MPNSFLVCFGHLGVFGEIFVQILCLFFLVVSVCPLTIIWAVYVLWMQVLYMNFKCLLPSRESPCTVLVSFDGVSFRLFFCPRAFDSVSKNLSYLAV